jgi:hypothetical protein
MYICADDAVNILRKYGIDIFECVSQDDWNKIVQFTSGNFSLSLDFTDKIEQRVGIEIESSENDTKLLDWLVDKGCCSREKSKAVLYWNSEFSLRCSAESDQVITIERKISHFKLVLKPNLPVMAKVYLKYSIK